MKATGEWQFDFVNSRFCDLTGLNREDLLNNHQNAFRIIHPDDFPEFISLVESVEKKPSALWMERKNHCQRGDPLGEPKIQTDHHGQRGPSLEWIFQ